jgi:hypothetical protein
MLWCENPIRELLPMHELNPMEVFGIKYLPIPEDIHFVSPNNSYKVECKSDIGEKKCRRIVDHKFTLKLYRDIVSALNGFDTTPSIISFR